MERCWDPSPDKRPHFLEIVQILDAEINKIPRKEYKKGAPIVAWLVCQE